MNKNDVFMVGASAVLTSFIAFTLAVPSFIEASGENEIIETEKIEQVLEVDGVKLTLDVNEETLKASEKPSMILTANNTSEEDIELKVLVSMMTVNISSGREMSRMGPMPEVSWSKECPIALKAGESKSFELQSDAAPGSNVNGYFNIVTGDVLTGQKAIAVANFTTPKETEKEKSGDEMVAEVTSKSTERQVADYEEVVVVED